MNEPLGFTVYFDGTGNNKDLHESIGIHTNVARFMTWIWPKGPTWLATQDMSRYSTIYMIVLYDQRKSILMALVARQALHQDPCWKLLLDLAAVPG